MNVFTSCFRRACALDTNKYLIVSISRFSPRGWKGLRMECLAPSRSLLKDYHEGLSWEKYVDRYRREVLSRVDVRRALKLVAMSSMGRDIVLCCYEDSPEHCHRSLVSQFIFEKYGYKVLDI